MAQWFDYQTVALAIIFGVGFGIVWCVLNWRSRPAPEEAATGDWHVILGVESNAPFEEIERAYRSQLARYDPENMKTLGADFSKGRSANVKRSSGPSPRPATCAAQVS